MAKTNAERVAEHRRRRKAAGISTITVAVPDEQVEYIRELARQLVNQAAHPGPEISAAPDQERLPQLRPWADQISREIASRGARLGQLLANHIGTEIVYSGWPIGQMLGSEETLQARFQVGRNVIREATRILENYGMARMRRGATGGLVVTAPKLDNAIYGIGVYLTYAGIRPRHLLEARRVIEVEAAALAAERADAEGLERLRATVDIPAGLAPGLTLRRLEEFHRTLAELTRDPALAVFIESILRLLRQPVIRDPAYELYWQRHNRRIARDSTAAHGLIVDAIAAGNSDEARRHMAAYLKTGEAWWLVDRFTK
jgi:DNA-binding FadR family transcriptional regulator